MDFDMNLEWAHAPIFFAASRIRLFYRAFLAVRRVRSLSLEKFLETSIVRRARTCVHHVKCVNLPSNGTRYISHSIAEFSLEKFVIMYKAASGGESEGKSICLTQNKTREHH